MTTRVGPMSVEDYRRAQARAMTEAQLLAAVWGTPRAPGIARVRGWLGYHTHRSDRSDPGFPDLALVRGGLLVFAELKTHKGKPTAPQREWLDALETVRYSAGDYDGLDAPFEPVRVYLWRPIDLLDGTIAAVLR